VKTLCGKTYTYSVHAGTTVAELKAMVAKDAGIPINQQRIIFRGKVRVRATSFHLNFLDVHRCAPIYFSLSNPTELKTS
jgi:hypothetical protein